MESLQSAALRAATGAELVALFEAERLDALMWYALRRATLNAVLFGDERRALGFAARALGALEREFGREHPDWADFEAVAEDPRENLLWGRLAGW